MRKQEKLVQVDDLHVISAASHSAVHLWPKYGRVDARITVVHASCLWTPIPEVDGRRVASCENLADLYADSGIPIWRSAQDRERIVPTPIIESVGDVKMLIDGLHRALVASRRNKYFEAIQLIPQESHPPPSALRRVHEVEICPDQPSGSPFFEGRHNVNFRPGQAFTDAIAKFIIQSLAKETHS